MTNYSNSRISMFEQCKYKYKLQYIDKVKVDIPNTIEAFMGDLVHKSLEKLYRNVSLGKTIDMKELLEYYHIKWKNLYSDKILIAKKSYTAEDYKITGERFLIQYFNHYHPFNQMEIVGLETEELMTLPDGNKYHVRIDKLARIGTTYYICDYKTNASMKTQDEADKDKQLAMYSIWVKDRHKDAEKVVLMWQMLAFNRELISVRSDDELQKLLDTTVKTIDIIEKTKDFPVKVTKLCDYCVYKSICIAFAKKDLNKLTSFF